MSIGEQTRWGLIGYGTIGQEVAAQVSQPEVSERIGLSPIPDFVVRTSGIMAPDGKTKIAEIDDFRILDLPPVTFSALPSRGDGELAMSFYRPILRSGKIVIAAEKAGIAHFAAELGDLSDDFARFGPDAAVGGGAHFLPVAKIYCHDPGNVSQIHAALNGTMDNIFSNIAPVDERPAMTLDAAVSEVKKKGFAEPEAETAYDVVRGETESDFPKKTAILFNMLGLSEKLLDWRQLEFSLKDSEIQAALNEAKNRRFIVSIYPEVLAGEHVPRSKAQAIIGGFNIVHDGWRIRAGFQHLGHNPLLAGFDSIISKTGAGNALMIGLGPEDRDGLYFVAGDGAGPAPTVNAMLDNYLRLSRQAKSLSDALPKVLPKELKTIEINTAEGPSGKRLTEEARMGWKLYQVGLECKQHALAFGSPANPPMVNSHKWMGLLEFYKSQGIPVFSGPAATLSHGVLTVTSSDESFVGTGLWVPREGEKIDFDLAAIKRLQRLV